MNMELLQQGYAQKKRTDLVLPALGFILILRLAFIGVMGIMPQDAYYYFYSEHPDLSHFDHPPGVAFMLSLFTSIFGKHVFVLKLAASVVTSFSLFAFYFLAKRFLNWQELGLGIVMLFSTFMITVLSLVVTPDVALIFFWIISLIMLYKALFEEKKWYWLWTGIMMGLAFDSKYVAVFLPAGMMLFLLISPAHRKLLLSPWPYLCILLFIVMISPVLIWNINNNFASFKFQSATRAGEIETFKINFGFFAGTFGLQAALLTPVLFAGILLTIWKTIKKFGIRLSRMPAADLFLLCFFLPLFGSFLLLGFFYWVKLNWLMPAYITGIILTMKTINEKWLKPQLIFAIVLHLVLAIQVIFYPIIIRSDDTWIGWKALARETKQLAQQNPDYFIFSADDYKTSAVLNFYLNRMVYSKEILGERALEFDYVGTDIRDLAGKNAIFIDSDPRLRPDYKTIYLPRLEQYFSEIKPMDTIRVMKNDRLVRLFFVYSCRNYNPDHKELSKN